MEKFKNYVLMAAGFAVLAAVISGFAAAPAIAALVKAALVKNVDERGRVPYIAEIVCSSLAAICSANIPAVSSGKRLVIEHVSGLIQINPAGRVRIVRLTYNGGANNLAFLHASPSNSVDPLFVISEPVVVYIEAGQSAFFEFDGSVGPTSASVILSGYLVDLTI
jgi:hypothetical protein